MSWVKTYEWRDAGASFQIPFALMGQLLGKRQREVLEVNIGARRGRIVEFKTLNTSRLKQLEQLPC